MYKSYSYYGFELIPYSIKLFIYQSVFFVTTLIFFPKNLNKPSDYFQLFYSLTVIFPNCFGTFIYLDFELVEQVLYFFIILTPLMVIRLLEGLRFKFELRTYLVEENKLAKYFLILAISLSFFILYKFYNIGSFDFIDTYSRRLEGRSIFKSKSPSSYLVGLLFNSIGPFFAFFGTTHKKIIWIIFSIALSILGFWSLGLKAPLFFSILFIIIGFNINLKKDISISLLFALNLLCIVGVLETYYSPVSIVSDYFIRRVFLVIPLIQSYYYETFLNYNFTEIIIGRDFQYYDDVTYFIGSNYFSNLKINANTNSYLYFLIKHGVFGYIINTISIVVTFLFLNNEYRTKKTELSLFIGILTSILIVEASFSSILFSTGVILLLMASFYSKRPIN